MAAGWTLHGAASVLGSAHEFDQTPCQDTHIVCTSPSGAWTGVVVCDGAGSAKFSKEGAEIASKHYAKKLMEIATELEQRIPGAWINDALIEGVVEIRQKLRVVARQDDLRDYHTTLLTVLVGPTGGVCVHIGDGAIFGGCFADEDGGSLINANWFLSEPENGEYANETYFITEAGWIKHLRISPLPPLDWIALATDGGAALALTPRNELKPGFMPGLFQKLQHGDIAPSLLIKDALLNPAFANITGDDKTLALLVRGGRLPPRSHSFTVAASAARNPPAPLDLEKEPTHLPKKLIANKEILKNTDYHSIIKNMQMMKWFNSLFDIKFLVILGVLGLLSFIYCVLYMVDFKGIRPSGTSNRTMETSPPPQPKLPGNANIFE